jgi:hypothetical protein
MTEDNKDSKETPQNNGENKTWRDVDWFRWARYGGAVMMVGVGYWKMVTWFGALVDTFLDEDYCMTEVIGLTALVVGCLVFLGLSIYGALRLIGVDDDY